MSDPLNPLSVARALEPIVDECSMCLGLGDTTSQVATLVTNALGLAEGMLRTLRSLEIMRDKHRLRNAISSGSSLNGLYSLVDVTPHDDGRLVELRRQVAEGLVVKPLSGSGSTNVHSITKKSQLRRLKLQPARIGDQDRDRLFDAARTVLAVAGYRFGLSHIEFILEGETPRLIEAHGRVGATAFEVLFRTYLDRRLPPLNQRGEHAAVVFPDLRSWADSEEKWLNVAGDAISEAVRSLVQQGALTS
ncbi:hypothetical protein [Corynebacterium yudongzhengii]|uniref:hypothetical protein n=1 Tax=Corynebacterium yudongzhengii TaxID=2080740 RepID=UPI0011B1D826|nr:hypothetical protein [Corynebacterium yudongzhengii]